MKAILFFALSAIFTLSCSKNNGRGRVEIFRLTSFQYKMDTTTMPATTMVVNPVLAGVPLVSNLDIQSYSPGSHTFTTSRDMTNEIANVDPRGALAVCVDGEPVYYIKIHPSYLSSLAFGIAVVDPIFYHDRKLLINFLNGSGTGISPLDKRNDPRLIEALAGTGRLK